MHKTLNFTLVTSCIFVIKCLYTAYMQQSALAVSALFLVTHPSKYQLLNLTQHTIPFLSTAYIYMYTICTMMTPACHESRHMRTCDSSFSISAALITMGPRTAYSITLICGLSVSIDNTLVLLACERPLQTASLDVLLSILLVTRRNSFLRPPRVQPNLRAYIACNT